MREKASLGGGHALDEQIDQSRAARIAPRLTEPDFLARVAFLGPKKTAMRIDNPPLGDLAQPGERLAVPQLDVGQRPHGVDREFLKDVIRLDFLA